MKRIAGYTLFWIGIGLLISFFLPSTFWTVCLTALFLILGYFLFCG